jgi:hypothetical protein
VPDPVASRCGRVHGTDHRYRRQPSASASASAISVSVGVGSGVGHQRRPPTASIMITFAAPITCTATITFSITITGPSTTIARRPALRVQIGAAVTWGSSGSDTNYTSCVDNSSGVRRSGGLIHTARATGA